MGVFFILEPVRLLGACKPGSRACMDSRTRPMMSGLHIMRMIIVLEVESPHPPQSDPAAIKASGWCQHWATN